MKTEFVRAPLICDICIKTKKMNTPKKTDTRKMAKALFLEGDRTREEIASMVGVCARTVIRWAKEDKWDELKAAQSITPDRFLAEWHRQIAEINSNISAREKGKRFPTPEEANALGKLASNIKKLQQEAGITEMVSVGMSFIRWMRPIDLGMAKKFSDLFDAYIKDSLKIH